MNFRIVVALESSKYEFCIEYKPTDRTWQLYYHQVKIMIIHDGTNILESGALLKCFSICQSTSTDTFHIFNEFYLKLQGVYFTFTEESNATCENILVPENESGDCDTLPHFNITYAGIT